LKFWMAHELGHCLSPNLEGEAAEDFADAFAGTLLYPRELARKAYESICVIKSSKAKVDRVLELAEELVISPYTVLGQVNEYAAAEAKPVVEMGQKFGGAVTNFNKSYLDLSETLFVGAELDECGKPTAQDYIDKVEVEFETPFFDLLREFLGQHSKTSGFVQTVLDMPILDARSIYAELT